jgi:predicted acetyltransferase
MTQNDIRPFDYQRDLPAVKRIWREVGWVDKDTEQYVDDFFAVGNTLVGTLDDVAECSVHISEGSMRLQHTDLPLCAVTAVTTSRIARGHAFARRLTARQLRAGAEAGAVVAALGMFDQGFYDQLGFGSGAYDHALTFDPGTLKVAARVPTPQRLSLEDYPRMHAAMLKRNKVNGSVCLSEARLMRAEFGWVEEGFGLGFGEGDELSHFVYLAAKGERGPYKVSHLIYQNAQQLRELLGLLKSLEDQVYAVEMIEPPEIQLQVMLERPFRNRALAAKGRFDAQHEAFAWWQLRILDVAACVAAYVGRDPSVRFQLQLRDPLLPMLDDAARWRGVEGDYVVELGVRSSAVAGTEPGLSTLSCSVNAFSRLLWGVAKASSLAVSDDLTAPDELLTALDDVLNLAPPRPGWDF